MVSAYIKSAVAGVFLLGFATAALAVNGEYGNMCSMGLALGKDIQTDCSINAQLQGKTYCFGSKEAMAEFMKNPTENLAKAQAYYSKKHPG
jgi:YHS domain-containing protein